MQAQGQLITLREGSETKAVIAPELGGWLLRFARHLPKHGFIEALHFAQEVVDRYPNQMYAGNPLLFPMVSFNHLPGRDNHYDWNGEVFELPQHGFARRSKWKVREVQDARVVMELRENAETLKAYPFAFSHVVTYQLLDGRLHFHQAIENRGNVEMPFSTGIHPYFSVPLTPAGSRSSCYVQLPAARRVLPKDDWASWITEPMPSRQLSVQEDVSGTLFLTGFDRAEISLIDPAAGVKTTLDFSGALKHRFVALWAKSAAEPYYCIEPWTALPNSFSRKTELIVLRSGERFEAEMWISVEAL